MRIFVSRLFTTSTFIRSYTCGFRSQTYLGDCFRRWKARLGTPKAITAMAHKLARILWHLIKYQEPYDPAVWAKAEEKNRQKKIKYLEKNAAALGFQLITNS